MINVVLDTNILHQEGFSSNRMMRLKRLIDENVISLTIPEMVLDEYKSKRLEISKKNISDISKAMETLKRDNCIAKDDTSLFVYESSVNKLTSKSKTHINESLDVWLKDFDVNVIKIVEVDFESVFNAYFYGGSCFRSPKFRNDIPDAVIFNCIENFAKEQKAVVIANDGGLKKSLDELSNVITFCSLNDFFEYERIKKEFIEIDSRSIYVNEIVEYLGSDEAETKIKKHIDISQLEMEALFSSDKEYECFWELDCISPRNFSIDYEFNIDGDDVTFDQVECINENTYSISFYVGMESYFRFSCDEAKLGELPKKYADILSEYKEPSDGTRYLNSDFPIVINGTIKISLPETEVYSAKELHAHLEYLDSKRNKIKISLTVDKIEINDPL